MKSLFIAIALIASTVSANAEESKPSTPTLVECIGTIYVSAQLRTPFVLKNILKDGTLLDSGEVLFKESHVNASEDWVAINLNAHLAILASKVVAERKVQNLSDVEANVVGCHTIQLRRDGLNIR